MLKKINERHCLYCHRLKHYGRCAAQWLALSDDVKAKMRHGSEKEIERRRELARRNKFKEKLNIYNRPEWKAEMLVAKEGLLNAFMKGQNTSEWCSRIRHLLDMGKLKETPYGKTDEVQR